MGLSLVLTETLGVTAGGVIVPGYIAVYLDQPYKIIATFAVALLVVFLWFACLLCLCLARGLLVACPCFLRLHGFTIILGPF